MKKILITGSSGYIGSHLSKMLTDTMKYEVHGLDIHEPQYPIHRFYNQDINRLFTLDEEFDAVIHLAALVRVGESEHMPIKYYITNLNGTMNVINRIKTKNFIFSSTGLAEYCYDPYGTSKKAAEDVVKEFCTTHRQTPYTIFRFYNVIGSTVVTPTNPDGLMYNLIKAKETGEFTIFGNDYEQSWDGTCVRDYVHVNEICDALMQAIENPSNSVESLGHGVGYTVKEIVNKFMEVNDVDFNVKYGPRRKGDLPSTVLEDVSLYMRNLYTMDELLKVDK
jgi:UDP-glucose 4-epimerase